MSMERLKQFVSIELMEAYSSNDLFQTLNRIRQVIMQIV